MSTILNTAGQQLSMPAPKPGFRCAVIVARWNSEVTDALMQGALQAFRSVGLGPNSIEVVRVPGTVELVYAAARAQSNGKFNAVIVIGCVIRGDTPHFDYVCQMAAQGTARLTAAGTVPVIFGVLTVDNLQQALDRAGGPLGNKGAEAAAAAVEMSNLMF